MDRYKIIIAAFVGGIVGGCLYQAVTAPRDARANYYSDLGERVVRAVEHNERMLQYLVDKRIP